MAGMTPFAYRKGCTILHRAGAGVKLFLLLGFSTAAFLLGLPALLAGTIAILPAAWAAGLTPKDLFSGVEPLLVALALVVVLRTVRIAPPGIDPEGLTESLAFAWGVLVSFAAGAVVFATTTVGALRAAVGRAEFLVAAPFRAVLRRLPFRWAERSAERLEHGRLSLGIALMLAFLPRVFEVWEDAEAAYKARFGKKGVRSILILVPLVTERLIEVAAETAQALEIRGAD